MNPAYTQAIERWHDFYILAGSAAATLLGLLFVAVSIRVEIFSGETASRARRAGVQALSNFFTVLVIALYFLIPDQTPINAAVTLTILGILGITQLVGSLNSHYWTEGKGNFRVLIQYLLFPLAYNATLLYVAYALSGGNVEAVGWLVWVIFSMLVSGTGTAWNMMVEFSRFTGVSTNRQP